MTLFQLIVTITGFIFVLFAIDLYHRQKFNLLHFLVFFGGTAVVVVFALNPRVLDSFGAFFGIARGADLVVYISIITLAYLYFESLHKLTRQNQEMTRLVSRLSRSNQSVHATLSTSDKKPYGFLIRAYNEVQMIGDVVQEIIDAGYTTIIICDDGSTDHTSDVIEKLHKDNSELAIVLLRHPINRGPGAANKTLFEYVAQYQEQYFSHIERRVTYDADGQMSIEDMKTFEDYANYERYDLIIGSRFVEGGKTIDMPLTRRVILWGGRIVTWMFNGSRLKDVTTGYRMYHHTIIPKMHITSDRYSYQHQIIDAIKKFDLRFVEIPVTIKYTAYSLTKGQGSSSAWRILKELIYKTFFYR